MLLNATLTLLMLSLSKVTLLTLLQALLLPISLYLLMFVYSALHVFTRVYDEQHKDFFGGLGCHVTNLSIFRQK